MDLRALSIFVKVAEQRSFVGAARELGMTQSGVSNAIGRLEEQLGSRLLNRTTRKVSLTEDGAAFFERCRQILSELDEAKAVLTRARLSPIGRLRVDLPIAFGRLKIVPLLGALRSAYPFLELVLSFTDRYVDLVEDGIDVAIRVGALRDSSLIARRLTQTRFRIVGAPSYLARQGRPRKLEDLERHNCLAQIVRGMNYVRDWRFSREGQAVALAPRGDMILNDGPALLAAAIAGYGLVQLADYAVEEAIAAGALVPVLEKLRPAVDPISLVYLPTRHLSPKVRAFVDFMAAQFR